MQMSESKKRDIALLVLRVAAGLIFVLHGYGKLFGNNPPMAGFTKMVAGMGFPMPGFFAYAAALSEFFGGLALILGIVPRIACLFLGIVMVVAFVGAKSASLPKGDPDLALLAIVTAIAIHGAGGYSLGAMLKKRGAQPQPAPVSKP